MKNAPLLYFLKGDILGAALVAALLRTLLAAEWTLRSAEGALRSARLTLCTCCSSRLIHLLEEVLKFLLGHVDGSEVLSLVSVLEFAQCSLDLRLEVGRQLVASLLHGFLGLEDESVGLIELVDALLLLGVGSCIGSSLVLHALKVVPFAPLVTTLQKIVILSFAAWLLFLSAKGAGLASRIVGAIFMCFPVLLAAFLFLRPNGCSVAELLKEASPDAADAPRDRPLTADELAGLAWLEHVTGTLDDKEEREWWDIGGTQHGIFSKRYHLAFAGYAAAAVGMRGDAEVRARVGKVIGNCLERMIRSDVWCYSMSKSYWGKKPWAPDPCYRENVMYTGHLLHLLAYYELFTGDRRYHRAGGGWDFVWKDGSKVHYDVEKLIDVTVEQMRKGPNGGVTCEPGLMFFACNSHPHVALAVFSKLGYCDWSADAARWEKWALSHYLSPAFGGGALNLVYHGRGNFMYPRGHDGFDGWSLLWYEAWASDRRTATALWRRVRERLDWSRLDSADDTRAGYGCCDPQPVSACVASVFLAAAARACSDTATAERLERAVDARYLRREGGLIWLDVNREWRIGATAMRIISLAESRGSRFREMKKVD